MKKRFGIVIAVLLCAMLPLTALAEGEDTALPEVTEETPAPADAVEITPAGDSDAYKDMLMDSFDKTLLGENESIKTQLRNILRSDEIVVTADNYRNIVRRVKETIETQQLSEGAALDSYTDEDFEVAAGLVEYICTELGLDYSIDPSNDSQNEYARVITIKKDGKLLGRINSDAKTDVGDRPSIGWLIGGGIFIGAAAVFAAVLIVCTVRKKKEAA